MHNVIGELVKEKKTEESRQEALRMSFLGLVADQGHISMFKWRSFTFSKATISVSQSWKKTTDCRK